MNTDDVFSSVEETRFKLNINIIIFPEKNINIIRQCLTNF